MGVQGLAIATNHPFNKYKAGQAVRGKVHFKLDEPKTIRGIYVKLKGLAKVSWTESKTQQVGGKSRTVHVRYYGEHEFFNDKIYFIGDDSGKFEIPAGNYDYKFDYHLPIGLPSSYEDDYGSIEYTVKAVIDIPWGFDDEEKIELEVMSPFDLNTRPQLKKPFHITLTKHLCCFLCRSGPLTMEVDIPKTGYTHGEDIEMRVDVENLTGSHVDSIDCKLRQKVTCHSQYPSHHTRETTSTLCGMQFDGVAVRCSNTYDGKLTIPKVNFLNFDNCNLIDIERVFEVEACISGCHCNLSAEIPITMGSVPIMVENSAPVPISILAGLGSPYPHEEQRQSSTALNRMESAPPYSFDADYGWMACAKAVG